MKKMTLLAMALLLFGVTQAVEFSSQAFTQPGWTTFAAFQQRYARLKHGSSDVGKNRYTSSTEAIGAAYSTGPWTVGGSLSYEYGRSKYDFVNRSGNFIDGNGKMRDQTFGVNLFGTYRMMDDWYASGNVFTGFADTKPKYMNSYTSSGTSAFSSFDSEKDVVFGSSLEVGKYFNLNEGFFIKPFVGFDYSYVPGREYNFMDNGQWGTMTVGSQNFVEVPVGFGIGKSFHSGNWVFTPNVDFAFINSIGKMDNKNYNPGFSSYDGQKWRTYGIAGSHYGGRISAGLDAKLNQKYDIGIDYTYEGRRDYNDHRISAMFGITF
jgi:Autotransporter beta-domain.